MIRFKQIWNLKLNLPGFHKCTSYKILLHSLCLLKKMYAEIFSTPDDCHVLKLGDEEFNEFISGEFPKKNVKTVSAVSL